MHARAECDPKFKDYAIYELGLPFNVARAYDEARGADRGPAESPKVLKGGTGSLIDAVYIWPARRVRKGNLDRNVS